MYSTRIRRKPGRLIQRTINLEDPDDRPADVTTTVTGVGSFDRRITRPEGDTLILGDHIPSDDVSSSLAICPLEDDLALAAARLG